MKTKITKFLTALFSMMFFYIIGYGQSVTINCTTSETVQSVLTIANVGTATDVTVTIPDGYTASTNATQMTLTGIPNTIQKLTIKGAGAGSYTNIAVRNISLPTTFSLNTFQLEGLSIAGAIGSIFIDGPAGVNITNLNMESCKLTDCRGYVRFNGSTTTYFSNIKINNSIIKNVSDYGLVNYTNATKGNLTSLTITNSSYYGMNDGIQISAIPGTGSLTFKNCTLDALDQRTNATGRYVVDMGSSTAPLTIENCILGRIGANQRGFRTSGTITSTGNHATSEWTPALYNLTTGLTTYAGTVSQLFTSPTVYNLTGPVSSEGDYTIIDGSFAGKSSAGDPRWYYQEGATTYTVTTASSPVEGGSTLPLTQTVNAGTIVIVSATDAFGYDFVEWKDASTHASVSTDKSYTFALNSNTDLVAVFAPVTTYDFTVNMTGTGASWGKVTLVPESVGGKYEAGTSVSMTPVSNLVSTFVQWDDATSTPKTVTVNSNLSFTATFNAVNVNFISGWDFNTSEPRNNRPGDYYMNSGNQGVFKLYDESDTNTSWTQSTVAGKTAARRWGNGSRYFMAEISTLGLKNIEVASKIAYDNNLAHSVQKLQYSTDGSSFTDVNTSTFTGPNTWHNLNAAPSVNVGWSSLNATLPAAANNQSTIYMKWIADLTSPLVTDAASSSSEGFYITDVLLSGIALSTDVIKIVSEVLVLGENNRISIYTTEKGLAAIYNVAGQKLEDFSLNSDVTTSTRTYKPGVYLINTEINGVKSVQKLILN